MAGALGEAVVEILADIDAFDADVRRKLKESADQAAARVQRDMDAISASAAEAGRNLATSLGAGAAEAADQIDRMSRLATQANAAFAALDSAELERVGLEAQQAQADFIDLARAARAAEGAFAGVDATELEGIALAAEAAAREVENVAQQARQAGRVIANFKGEELIRLATEAQVAADRLARLSRTPLNRIGGEARQAGIAIAAAFRSGANASEEALNKIDNTTFNKVVRAAVVAAVEIRAAFDRAKKGASFDDVGKHVVKAFKSILTAGFKLAALGLQFASLVSVVGAVGTALAPTVGIVAGLPAVALLAAGAIGTLKIGLAGVGDAFKAAVGGDAKAFEASIKNLAPAAQSVAKEVRALKPQLDGLKKSVQGALFKPLIGQLTAVAKNLGGPLKAGTTATAAQFGRLAASVTTFGKSASAVKLVNGVFGTLKTQIAGIKSGTITGLLSSVSAFVRATLPGFAGLGTGIDGLLKRLTDFLNKAATGGKALSWLQNGKKAVADLAAIFGNLGSVAGGIGKAIQAAGAGSLAQFKDATAAVSDFVGDAKNAASLVEIFKAINSTALAAAPAAGALAAGLAKIAPIVQQLSTKLGPILTQAITGLVPVAQSLLSGLLPVFDGIGQGIAKLATGGGLSAAAAGVGSLLAALAPLGSTIGNVLNAALAIAAPLLQTLAPALKGAGDGLASLTSSGGFNTFAASLKGLASALVPLGPAVGTLLNGALKDLEPLFSILGGTINALTPLISGLAQAFAFIANSPLAPVLSLLVVQFGAVALVTGSVSTAFSSLLPTLRFMGGALKLVSQGVIFLGRALVVSLLENPIVLAIAAIVAILVIAYFKVKIFRDIVNAIGAALLTAGKAILGFGQSLVSAFQKGGISGLISKIGSSLGNLGGLIGQGLGKVGGLIASGLSSAFSAVVSFFANLPGNAASALATFGPKILSAITSGLVSVLTFIVGFQIKVLLFFVTLPFKIAQALVKFGPSVLTAIATGLGAVLGFLAGFIIKALLFFVTLPFKIAAALLQFGPSILGAIVSGLGQVLLFVANFIIQVLAFFITLPFRILGALLSLALYLKQPFIDGVTAVITFLGTAILAIINFFIALPGRIVSALLALPGLLASAASAAWNFFKTATVTVVNATISFVRSLPGRIRAGLSALAGFLSSAASAAWNAFKSRTSAGISAAISFIRTLPGKALSALSSFVSRMTSLGRDIIQGLINGIKSLAGNILSSITGPINDAIGKAKSLLGIGSPSKVFHAIGDDTMQGFINGVDKKSRKVAAVFRGLIANVIADTGRGFVTGLTGTSAKITSTINKIVADVTKAFKGKKSNIDNGLIALLDGTNKKLQALVKKRQSVADTIKAANDFAANATTQATQFAALTGLSNADQSALTGSDISKQLAARLAAIKAFQANVTILAKRGLAKSALAQIVNAGPDQGGALASAIAKSDTATLAAINSTQKQIDAAATALGKTSADVLFDSGANAGKGFLTGLQSQEKAITALMTRIAKSAAAAVKKELKIKSPSQVMSDLGEFTIKGFLAGIAALAPQIDTALSAAVKVRDSLASRLQSALGGGQVSAAAAAAVAGTTGAAGATGAGLTSPGITAPRTAGDQLAAVVSLLDRIAARADAAANVRTVEVQAPITVNLPTADPDAVAQIISRRITNVANR